MDLVLARSSYTNARVMGTLFCDELNLHTVERPWIENPKGPGGMPKVSCVPEGRYTLKPHDSQKFPGSYILINMQLGVYSYPDDIPDGQGWGRSAILIHSGNAVDDVIGCIAVGLRAQGDMVYQSKDAMVMLREKLGRSEPHRLSIIRGDA